MRTTKKTFITVSAQVQTPIELVWKYWTNPKDIVNWNYASEDWHCPSAENDLQHGGKFTYLMEAKDGSFGFDFWGIYKTILPEKLIESELGDGRMLKIEFSESSGIATVTETFEAENTNPVEMQKNGWQAILNNFKKYVESKK